MTRIRSGSLLKGAALLFAFGILACAALPRLNVNYRLPPRAQDLGPAVYLSVQDDRPNKETFRPGARKEFGGPEASISLTLKSGESEQSLGIFEVPMLFREAFQRRLGQAGVSVRPERRAGEPEISILLKTFSLDLVDRKWLFEMSFDARLLRDGKLLTTQMINGKGERLKIYGLKQAEDVVTEVFTDTINQFDAARLFRQAGL